jgi:serine beta-lactamase-like protein LACTB
MRHYRATEYFNNKRYAAIAETLKTIQDEPLLQQPGTKYSYSSYGFNLLGAALEAAASQGFLLLVQRQVCGPLGMESTADDDNTKIVTGRTRFYSLTGGEICNSPYTGQSDRWPSGGFLSTAEDLAHFGAAHLGDAFLKPDTRRLLFTSQRTSDGKETGVGFGWRIATIANRRVYHHGGDSIGGRAFLLLLPDNSIAVAFVSNLDRIKFAETEAMALAEAFS